MAGLDAPSSVLRPREVIELPAEIWDIIFKLLDFRTVMVLGTVCRLTTSTMRGQRRSEFGHVRLSSMQASIRDRAGRMPDAPENSRNVFTLQAPMGFGKTITSLSFAFTEPSDSHRYVYVVPPKAF